MPLIVSEFNNASLILSDKDPFSSKAWREYLNQSAFLRFAGLTEKDVVEALAERNKQQEEAIKQEQLANQLVEDNFPKCPTCETAMQILSLNDSPATQTNDDSKSMWLCRKCHYEQFSNKSVEEELQWLVQE